MSDVSIEEMRKVVLDNYNHRHSNKAVWVESDGWRLAYTLADASVHWVPVYDTPYQKIELPPLEYVYNSIKRGWV